MPSGDQKKHGPKVRGVRMDGHPRFGAAVATVPLPCPTPSHNSLPTKVQPKKPVLLKSFPPPFVCVWVGGVGLGWGGGVDTIPRKPLSISPCAQDKAIDSMMASPTWPPEKYVNPQTGEAYSRPDRCVQK